MRSARGPARFGPLNLGPFRKCARRAERLVELSAITDRLAAVLEADYVPVWLNRPLAALGHRKPIDVLAGGGYEELSRLIAALESPTFT